MELSVEKNRFIEGASQGFLYPSVMVVLHVQATSKGKLAGNLEHSLIAAIPHANAHLSEVAADDHQAEALLAATLLITHDILLYFDYPSERLPTFHSDDLGEHHCIASVQISCLSSRAFIAALKIAWSALQRAAKGGAPLDLKHPRLKSLVMQLRADAPQGFNTKHLLLEAQSRQIPWERIWANTFQLGYGCYARLFDSSVSDSTSKIGTELVRNKIATNTFLMAAGFPVMTSKIVTSAEMAVQEAISNIENCKLAEPGEFTKLAFQNGKINANIDLAKTMYEKAQIEYSNSLLSAFSEIESKLSFDQMLTNQVVLLSEALKEAEDTYDLSKERYNKGLVDLITVIDSQKRMFDTRSRMILARQSLIDNRIDLLICLGGDFSE